jgi:hypothetical protein
VAEGVTIVTPKLMASSSGKTAMFIANQPADPKIHEAAIRIARRGRWLIQGCLRQEEWGDADREFYLVIREELERLPVGKGCANQTAAGERPGA